MTISPDYEFCGNKNHQLSLTPPLNSKMALRHLALAQLDHRLGSTEAKCHLPQLCRTQLLLEQEPKQDTQTVRLLPELPSLGREDIGPYF